MSGRALHLQFLLTVTAAVLCLIGTVSAQTFGEPQARARAERFREQVVRVLTETMSGVPGEPGFGIIVGEANGRLYIATPHHVAFGRDPRNTKVKDTPSVLFYTDPNARPILGRRLDSAASPQENDDLAVLEVATPAGFRLPRVPMVQADKLLIGSWVWNVGIGGDWELPFRAGGLGTIDPLTRWRRVGALRTPGGSSGGAAVTEDGILGMVERDGETYSLILPIERVAELFRAWRLPVNLIEPGPAQSAPAAAQPLISSAPAPLLVPSAPAPPPAVPTTTAAATTPRAGERFRDCATCPEMVVIPAGAFQMGSPPGEKERVSDEGPQQRIAIAAFAAGRYEVTFAEWDACAAAGGCGSYRPSDEGWGRGSRPVINVSWQHAQSYVTWLSGQTRQRYRLLTEAEWEYAARAGTVTPFSTGAQISTRPGTVRLDGFLRRLAHARFVRQKDRPGREFPGERLWTA